MFDHGMGGLPRFFYLQPMGKRGLLRCSFGVAIVDTARWFIPNRKCRIDRLSSCLQGRIIRPMTHRV